MFRYLALLCCAISLGSAAHAQADRRPSHCIAIADAAPGLEFLHNASWQAPVPDHTVRVHYIAHASFLIQTQGGLTAVTDFTGFIGTAPLIPDVVTMNHAHDTHWTANPDPAIPHVLKGWGDTHGSGIEHHLDLEEMLVRNVSTDIRSQYGGVEENGNSIFIFEVAGLCIGHLGHLHQEPSPEQYAAIGRLDVAMVPVDGGYTLPTEMMQRIVRRLKSSVVIPMHWFSDFGRERFVAGMTPEFDVRKVNGPAIEVSLRSLPKQPTIFLLQPAWLRATQP
ncbi:MAG: MBL fold metallo-hydrolase [Pseudomonadota bacterium]